MRGIRPYARAEHIEPFFVEGIASVFTGLILLAWGLIFLSNDFFQLSVLVRLRNAIAGAHAVEETYRGVAMVDVDPDSILVAQYERDAREAEYLLMAEGLRAVAAWARALDEPERVVVGLDYALLQPASETSEGMRALVEAIAAIPSNVSLVMGARITAGGGDVRILRSDLYFSLFRNVVAAADGTQILERLHLGHLHYMRGRVQSGIETVQDVDAAIAYLPSISSGGEFPRTYPSLALAMFMAGTEPEYRTNHAEGDAATPELIGAPDHTDAYFLDFPTDADISSFPDRFARLYNYSTTLNPFAFPDEDLFAAVPNENTYYVLVGRSRTAEAIGDENLDTVVTVASAADPVLGVRPRVSGAMVHLTALGNLLNGRLVRQARGWVPILFAVIAAAIVIPATLRRSLVVALPLTIGTVLAVFAGSLLAFLSGSFVTVQMPSIVAVLSFAVASSVRFVLSIKWGFSFASLSRRMGSGDFTAATAGHVRKIDDCVLVTVKLRTPDEETLAAGRDRVSRLARRAGGKVDAPTGDTVMAVLESPDHHWGTLRDILLDISIDPSVQTIVALRTPLTERVFLMMGEPDFAFSGCAVPDTLVVCERVCNSIAFDTNLVGDRELDAEFPGRQAVCERHRGTEYVVVRPRPRGNTPKS